MSAFPPAIRDDISHARKLEWWTLGGMGSVLVVMYFAMGSSQAMKAALLEDILSLFPALSFLVATKLEPHRPTEKFQYGFIRVGSLAFLASAVVLTMMGAWLLYDGASALLRQEHPSIGPIELFGHDVWLGWVMIAALLYSVIVPMVLGHKKLPVARRLCDKVLHTDADMQKADWMTGLAGILGILGIGFGLWWADAAAASFIAFSVLRDGSRNIRSASAELLDGAPRRLENSGIAEDAIRLRDRLEKLWPGADVRVRESGRYLIADVAEIEPPKIIPPLSTLMGEDADWRLAKLSFTPPGCGGRIEGRK